MSLMGETKPWAILIVVFCTVFTSAGSLFLKLGMNRFVFRWPDLLNAYPVVIGLFFYFLGFILLTIAFRYGELSVLFPFVSLSFVWVAILAFFFLGELMRVLEIVGLASIVCGVVLIGISSKKSRKLKLRG